MKTHAERLRRHLDFLVENLFRKNPPMPLREAVARLSKKDRSVNLDLVAHWYQDRNAIQWGNYLHEIAEKLETLLLRSAKEISSDQVRQIVIQFLLIKGLVTGDEKLAFQAISREQTEVTLGHSARGLDQKDRMVAVAEERLLVDQRKLDPTKLLKIARNPDAGLPPEAITMIERELRLL
jgi:hypothetical protein